MSPEDTVETASCYSCCCDPVVDAAPAIEEPIVADPAPVIEEPVAEAPAPPIEEPVAAVAAPAPPEPTFEVTQPTSAPELSPESAAQTLEPGTAVIGGPEPDEFAGLRQTIEPGSAIVGGPVPNEFADLGRTLASSTVVGGPLANEFANLGQPQSGSPERGWVSPGDDLLIPNPTRTADPNIALFAPQAWQQWGDAMGQLQAAMLNSALLGPANHTAQYSSSLGVDWVENGRSHV